ncbi:hypothetical protein PYCCODRAFT_239844 [Trametes coccinea BRFM310]|uniref:Uncharacterized protein n=1 Tax=Trametes coccinea (strain BRFM310) TaxID=1353009 RepID=A0A1Y2ISH9_TRAC3|nr:hypothetical protein PYCCODRAFT_239844 [Trametes coccinea BRFM310]
MSVTTTEATHDEVSLCTHPSLRIRTRTAPHRCHRSLALLHVSLRETDCSSSGTLAASAAASLSCGASSWRTCRRRSVTACLRRRVIMMLALVPPLSARCVSPASLFPGALYHP